MPGVSAPLTIGFRWSSRLWSRGGESGSCELEATGCGSEATCEGVRKGEDGCVMGGVGSGCDERVK